MNLVIGDLVIGFLVSLFLAARPVAVVAQAPTVDDLVARNIQAKGGLEKLQAIQAMKETGRVTIQGMDAALTIYLRRPNLTRQEVAVAGQTIVNAFDGTTAWIVNPLTGSTSPVIITGPDADAIKDQSDFDGPLIGYKEKGYAIELAGAETLNGRPVQHLKLTSPRKQIQHYYLDAESGLEMKVVTELPNAQLGQELSDYRDVGGVKVPFGVRTFSNGQLVIQLTLDRIELNPKLDDAMFKPPVRAEKR